MRNKVFRVLGILCIVFALGISFRNVYLDQLYKQFSLQTMNYIQKQKKSVSDVVVYENHAYLGYIEIEELNLKLPIQNEYTYEDMALSPCRYAGSLKENNMIICAHNSYNHFGRLKNLSIGSKIRIICVDGKKYTFKVRSIEILKANDINKMKQGNWDLTLFTCTLDARNRVTVRCSLD